jgi:hypothetical protein
MNEVAKNIGIFCIGSSDYRFITDLKMRPSDPNELTLFFPAGYNSFVENKLSSFRMEKE